MNHKQKNGWIILFLAIIVLFGAIALAPNAGSSSDSALITGALIHTLSHDNKHIELVMQFPPAVIETVAQEDELFHRPSLQGWFTSDQLGGPIVPEKTFYIALPPSGPHRVEYFIEKTKFITNLNIPILTNSDKWSSWRGVAKPDPMVRIGEPYWIRYQRVLPITVSLWQVDGWGKKVQELQQLRLVISMRGGDAVSAGRQPVRSNGTGPELAVLNPIEGKGWLAAPRRSLKSRSSNFFGRTSNPWLKIRITKRGIYRISYDDAEDAGFPVDEVDLSLFRCFAWDQMPLQHDLNVDVDSLPTEIPECAILVEDGGEIGVWEEEDAIIFLANGPDGWYQDRGAESRGMERYHRHPLSSYAVYWMTWGNLFEGNPARMDSIDGDPAGLTLRETGEVRLHLERNTFYDPRQKDPDATWEKFWYLQAISDTNDTEREVKFNITNVVEGEPSRVRARYWGANNRLNNIIPDHIIVARLNDVFVDSVAWESYDRKDIDQTVVALRNGENIWHYLPPHIYDPDDTNRSDKSNLAWIDIDYVRWLKAENDSLEYFGPEEGGVQAFRITGFSSGAAPVVFNATDLWNPYTISGLVVTDGSEMGLAFSDSLSGPTVPHYVVLDLENCARPVSLETVERHGDWIREVEGPVDAIIIVHPDLQSAAEDLAEYRRQYFPDRDEAVVVVKNTEEIFDEFSWGTMDVAAMRNFLEYSYVNWVDPADETRRPLYVTFFGDAYYDPRDYLKEGGVLRVPTYQNYYDSQYEFAIFNPQFSSDDWFILFDGPSDSGLDMLTGRLPVRGLTDANALVQKTISYEQESPLDWWKTRIGLLADDRCQHTEWDRLLFAHNRQTELIADSILAPCFHPDRIYLYEYGWPYEGGECRFSTKPEATEDLLSLIHEGILVMNYTGHGSSGQLADERLLETSLVSALTNDTRPFLFVNASCSVGKHDIAGFGLGESLVLRSKGGAVVMFAASSVASSGSNAQLNRALFNFMYPDKRIGDVRPIGEAALKSKMEQGGILNTKRYIYLGDPMVKLASPRHEIDLEWIETGGAGPDTLIRGGAVTLAGTVKDTAGIQLEDFNGWVSLRIYDSEISRHPSVGSADDYNLLGAPIFRGDIPVTGGEFSFDFVVPKSLVLGERGWAKVYAYAQNGETDALGCRPQVWISETEAQLTDSDGPEIELSMASTDSIAYPGDEFHILLTDPSGINITELVGSRSVVLRFNDSSGRPLWVEDLAGRIQFLGSSVQAEVTTSIPSELPTGRSYTAVVRASDNLNNQTEAGLSFRLMSAGDDFLTLERLFNFPNPFEERTRFFLEVAREVNVEISIYTARGRRIRKLEWWNEEPASLSEIGLFWDGRDADGDRLANGIYFYRVRIRDPQTGESVTRIEKCAVLR